MSGTSVKKNVWEKISSVDQRVFYAIMLFLLIFPMVSPLGIPMTIGETTRSFYNRVQSLPSGSVVLVCAEIGPIAYPELAPGTKAFMEQVLRRDIKVLVFCDDATPTAPPMWEQLMSKIVLPPGKRYGVDWVFLGWIPGGETAVAGLANDIWRTTPVDYYGTQLKDLPMMQNIRNARDISLYFDVTMGTDTLERALRQFNTPYGTPVMLNTAAGMIPATMPYYPRQVVGVLYGIRGGAEYEMLVGKPWLGLAYMDVMSTVNLYVVIVVIIGNLAFLARKMSEKKRGK